MQLLARANLFCIKAGKLVRKADESFNDIQIWRPNLLVQDSVVVGSDVHGRSY